MPLEIECLEVGTNEGVRSLRTRASGRGSRSLQLQFANLNAHCQMRAVYSHRAHATLRWRPLHCHHLRLPCRLRRTTIHSVLFGQHAASTPIPL